MYIYIYIYRLYNYICIVCIYIYIKMGRVEVIGHFTPPKNVGIIKTSEPQLFVDWLQNGHVLPQK